MRLCARCSGEVPEWRRSDARYCSQRCRSAAEKARYRQSHPSYSRVNSARFRANNPMYTRQRYRRSVYGDGHVAVQDMRRDRYRAARDLGFRSGLEVKVANQLDALGVKYEYEPGRIPYLQPAKKRQYTPDWVLPNGIVLEGKGHFTTEERNKFKLVKESHPDLDLRFVFSNSNTRISKQSKTSYAKWATDHGFPWCNAVVPLAWLQEPVNQKSLDIIKEFIK